MAEKTYDAIVIRGGPRWLRGRDSLCTTGTQDALRRARIHGWGVPQLGLHSLQGPDQRGQAGRGHSVRVADGHHRRQGERRRRQDAGLERRHRQEAHRRRGKPGQGQRRRRGHGPRAFQVQGHDRGQEERRRPRDVQSDQGHHHRHRGQGHSNPRLRTGRRSGDHRA